ncbi:MAG: SusD/RagB family nutrient-binding outer membrane lipoprotein [Flavobacteriaceae bacterium]|nr:SusD/RagB family nutrient-binding outer membrane lipoprotein [Flavobacteriaceae bacterium]
MKKIILIAFLIISAVSCETDFSDWNKDEKNASKVPASTLFSNAERNLVRTMKMQNVNINIFNYFAQYWTATTYPDEANYDIGTRDVPGGFWDRLYRDVLLDLQETKLLLAAEKKLLTQDADITINTNKMAITTILEVYTFHVLVDVFGDVPYSEALDITNPSPKYDDASAIYTDIFTKLDLALSQLNTEEESFGGADFIYEGKVSAWKKFGNSLKLRMALRVKDGDKISEAIAGGVFTSNADNASFEFTKSDPYSNPLWENLVQSNRNDILIANSFVDLMTPLNDPRTEIYMANNITPYKGGPYGANNSYAKYTHLGPVFHKPDYEGIILDYSEVEFLLAEAAARILGGASDAEGHYNKGIKASIQYWTNLQESYDDDSTFDYKPADTDTYITNTPYDAVNWKKSIGTQKYIAMYSRGFEGWTTWRIFGVPTLLAPEDAAKGADGKVPVRYVYPADESQRNGTNYKAASAAIGGDKLTTLIFWNN